MASFLQKIFKTKTITPQWQHESASVRLESISSDLPAEVLILLAKKDDAKSVRLKAISQLESLTELATLFSDKNTEIKQATLKKYLKIATEAAGTQQQIDNLGDIKSKHENSTEILLIIASESSDQKMAEAAMDLIQDEAALYDFIMSSNSAKSRVKAAEKINISSMLKAIEAKFKGKDKTLHRLVKNKLQQQQDTQARIEAKQQATESLLNQAKQLTSQAFSPTFEGQLAHLKQAWKKAEFTNTYNDDFLNYITQCESVLSQVKAQQQTIEIENQVKQDALSFHNQAIELIDSTLKQYKEKNVKSATEVTAALTEIEGHWNKGQELSQASKSVTSDYTTELNIIKDIENALISLNNIEGLINKKNNNIDAMQSQKKAIKALINSIKWPKDISTPANLTKLLTAESEIDNSIEKLKDGEKSNIESVERKIDELKVELDNGNLKNADKIQQYIKKELTQIERNQSKHLQANFQTLTSELERLKDWKGFVAEPKFVELCESMEGLIDSALEPKDLAKAIQSLQNQWKALGSLGDKKQHNQLWARFKIASDLAYKPCQEFYDGQSNSRAFNLEQRQVICEQLEALFQQQNWDQANWKALQKIIDKSFHEYKKFAPVDRAVNSAIQKRFNEATSAIKQKLQGYYQSNLDAKQALIDECSSLLEAEDISGAINRCKEIQNIWKTIESAGKTEQSLWIEFRKKCDAIFELRNQAYQAKKEHTDSLIDAAKSLLEQAKLLGSATTTDALKQLIQYKLEIQLMDIPSKIKAAKDHEIAAVEAQVKLNIEQASKNQDSQRWTNAQQISAKIADFELGSDDSLDSLKIIINETDLPKAAFEVLLKRLESPIETDTKGLQAHCLDFEIAMGIDSPVEDQQARMAVQIKRLQENMGKQQLNRQQANTQAQLTWFSFSGKADDYQAYQDRFFAAVKQAN
jgi:exonuclease SbcC